MLSELLHEFVLRDQISDLGIGAFDQQRVWREAARALVITTSEGIGVRRPAW